MKRTYKKKIAILICILITVLTGCGKRDMNDIIKNEPSISGIVYEVENTYCIMKSDGSEYQISLEVENADSYTDLKKGDEIAVYYDGNIAESYPMQINKVYAITVMTPTESMERVDK